VSDTILSGDWTVYYGSENRQQRIEYTGSGTTYTVNQLYSALQNNFDELNQMDDGSPMSAQTPTEYTIGVIDSGDDDPWFIDRTSVEFLTGGAIQTASWDRVEGSNTGIIRVPYTETVGAFSSSMVGLDITMAVDGDAGTLLDYSSSAGVVWIRPDTSAAANSFDDSPSSSDTMVVGGSTIGTIGPSTTGESLWANINTIGTIEADTHIYVNQNGSVLSAYKGTNDWWDDGQIDVLINVKECDTETDEGVIQVFARQYSKTFDNFETDLSAGGRTAIPLATADDLDNTTGYKQMAGTGGVSDFDVDNYLYVGSSFEAATAWGVVTASSGAAANPVVSYYLMGDLTDFSSGDTVQEYDPEAGADGDGSMTVSSSLSPTDIGPAALTTPTITHAADETFDIDEDGTTENYSIVIDCSSETLADVYEWTKYELRRGSTTTDTSDGIEGQLYIGTDYKIDYTTLNETIPEGSSVTQLTTNATGIVVAHNTTDKILMLRNSRGTFNNSNNIEMTVSSSRSVTGPTAKVVTPKKAAPYGTFAGGTWFCARGVVLDNVPSADANNYQLTDDDGTVREAPTKVTLTVGNARALDRISAFRLTGSGGDINKSEYNAATNTAGSSTFILESNVTADTPAASAVRLVDGDNNVEYRMRYASFASSTFTLSHSSFSANAGTGSSEIFGASSSEFADDKIGDLVYASTYASGGVAYVESITGSSKIVIAPAITGMSSGYQVELNAVPIATSSSDTHTAYVPLIDVHETTGSSGSPGTEEALITYSSDINVRIRARQAGDILPYEADVTLSNVNLTNNIIRTPDTIHN